MSLEHRTFDAADYGAGPDKTPEENTRAAQEALEACRAAGGGGVHLPTGQYLPLSWDESAWPPRSDAEAEAFIRGAKGEE